LANGLKGARELAFILKILSGQKTGIDKTIPKWEFLFHFEKIAAGRQLS
jgi:hypothetical protein